MTRQPPVGTRSRSCLVVSRSQPPITPVSSSTNSLALVEEAMSGLPSVSNANRMACSSALANSQGSGGCTSSRRCVPHRYCRLTRIAAPHSYRFLLAVSRLGKPFAVHAPDKNRTCARGVGSFPCVPRNTRTWGVLNELGEACASDCARRVVPPVSRP